MGPKKSSADKGIKKSSKTVTKEKNKIIEDKTFGLKNKNKSNKVKKYIKNVELTVKLGSNLKGGEAYQKELEFREKAEKKKKEEKDFLLNSLLNTATDIKEQSIKAGEDPKSILCVFFKAGCCKKGNKCKFSHDLSIESKAATINLYQDSRDVVKGTTMDQWDENTLNTVIQAKESKRGPSSSNITCKFFIEAVEKRIYGWFWECPNGEKCVYRHCLPQGYVLQRDQEAKKKQEKENKISLEEDLENKRQDLQKSGKALTPCTLENFTKWKEKKRIENEKKIEEERKKEAKRTGGKGFNILSGRALFKYDPSAFKDDENAVEDIELEKIEEENKENVNEPISASEDQNKEEKVEFKEWTKVDLEEKEIEEELTNYKNTNIENSNIEEDVKEVKADKISIEGKNNNGEGICENQNSSNIMKNDETSKLITKNLTDKSDINGKHIPNKEEPNQIINDEILNTNKDEKQNNNLENSLQNSEEEKGIDQNNNILQQINDKKEPNFDFEVKAENFNIENNNESNDENKLDYSNDNEEQEEDLIDKNNDN